MEEATIDYPDARMPKELSCANANVYEKRQGCGAKSRQGHQDWTDSIR